MYLSRLTLQNYRNYAGLDLTLSPGTAIFLGANAQGKSNLLEAIYLLAAMRAPRSRSDVDLIRSSALGTEFPAARVSATAERRRGAVEVTITIGATRDGPSAGATEHGRASKRLLVNGVARRASDVVGQIAAVLFTAQDMDIVSGPPALRRRYLDVTLSQTSPFYLRALQRYSRVLLQRNTLLRRIHEGSAGPDQLPFWDSELVSGAALIMAARLTAVRWLSQRAAELHARLSGNESLEIAYQPQLPKPLVVDGLDQPSAELQAQMLAALRSHQRREIDAGVSLFGPHRDDLGFVLGGEHLGAFGSRAQQRTAALALRLAEAGYIEQECGDQPVLLLDDILSELDEARRSALIDALSGVDQILISATEAEPFGAGFLARSERYRVSAGTITTA